MEVPYGDAVGVIDAGLRIVAVWISSGTIGAMTGGLAAVAQRKPLRKIELWSFRGGAMGFAFGFLLMVCAIAALTRS